MAEGPNRWQARQLAKLTAKAEKLEAMRDEGRRALGNSSWVPLPRAAMNERVEQLSHKASLVRGKIEQLEQGMNERELRRAQREFDKRVKRALKQNAQEPREAGREVPVDALTYRELRDKLVEAQAQNQLLLATRGLPEREGILAAMKHIAQNAPEPLGPGALAQRAYSVAHPGETIPGEKLTEAMTDWHEYNMTLQPEDRDHHRTKVDADKLKVSPLEYRQGYTRGISR